MDEIQDRVTLHEKTVQDPKPLFKRRYVRRENPNGDVVELSVHPAVWAKAMELAEGDWHRIEVFSELEVLVHNRPHR